MKRSGWTSHGKGKVGRFDEHVSGWRVLHCGHPTALWPWYAESPDGKMVVSESGYAWRKLETAREHIEQALAGARAISYQYVSNPGNAGRLVPRCYACDAPSTGRARPAGPPRDDEDNTVPACSRHRCAELGTNPLRYAPQE